MRYPEKLLRTQTGDARVADKDRAELGVVALRWLRQFEIENADTKSLFAIISAAIACADHDALVRSLFASQVNHRMGNRRVAIDVVGSGPEQQITRLERIELK